MVVSRCDPAGPDGWPSYVPPWSGPVSPPSSGLVSRAKRRLRARSRFTRARRCQAAEAWSARSCLRMVMCPEAIAVAGPT